MSASTADSVRRGYWLFDRAYFEEVESRCGVWARLIMIELVNAAHFTDGRWTFVDGTHVDLHRGDVVASGERLASRVRCSRATVARTLHALERAGFIRFRSRRWLRNGKGAAPSIVNISDYDRFSGRPTTATYCPEISLSMKEVTDKEDIHQRREPDLNAKKKEKNEQGDGDIAALQQEATAVTNAENLLAFYRSRVRVDCDEDLAMNRAVVAVQNHPAATIAVAAIAYRMKAGERCCRAENFFRDDMYLAYL